MFRSKALKEFDTKEKRSKLYLWWIESDLCRFWDKWSWKLWGNPIFQIKRLYQWYTNVFHKDYDFDAHCLFAIIEYKLKRVQRSLENGHAWQEPKDMKALRLAIKLAGRLKEDQYDMIFMDRHDKKWGKMDHWTVPDSDRKLYAWHSSRPKAVFKKDKEQERKEFRAAYEAADKQMRREERWFYDILRNHLRVWWD